MNRQQKESLVQALQGEFSTCEASYVIGYRGLSVNALRNLRAALRPHNAHFKVAKMRLVKRAIAPVAGLKDVAPFLNEQRGIIFVKNEPTAVAKALCDFAKEHEHLAIIAGYVDQEILDTQGIQVLASLPSRTVLRAQVLGTMNAPITRCAGLLHLMIARLLLVLQQVHQKKEKEVQ